MELSDSVVAHLREVAGLPDLEGTGYELEEEIGRGGLGVVYRAYDRALDRRVALKVVDGAMAQEARVIACLEHPGIVPIHRSGELPDGRWYYAMKLVTGVRLDRFGAGAASVGERLRVVRRVAEVLAFAHSRGVVHRDLKPQNVMTGEFGEVYVMDWGVPGVTGTPPFRAPEAVLDARSDLFSLGALLRFLIPTPESPALRAIAGKALSERAEDRYASAAAFLADLGRFEDGHAVEAWREPLGHRVRRFAKRNEVLLWLVAAYAGVKLLLFFLRTL